MSEPSPSVPPGGQAAARNSARTGGRLFAVLCWIVLLPAAAVLAVGSFVRAEHREAADLGYALAEEQRSVAAAAAKLVEDMAGGPLPAVSRASALHARSLELIALVPLRASAELQAEWGRLAAGLGAIEAEWARILAFRTGLEALRREARILREESDRLAEALSAGDAIVRGGAETLAIASRQLSEEVDRARLVDPAGLERARALLDVLARAQRLLAAGIGRLPVLAAPGAESLATVGARTGAARERLEAVVAMAGELGAVPEEVRRIAAGSARVARLLPEFEARGRRSPALLGASLDALLMRAAVLALAALLGLLWRRDRLLRAEAAELDQAWGEAAESDWRARGLVRDLLRAIDTLDRKGAASGAPAHHGELEGRVREATASLPRIVARRSRLAAALLSAHDSLRERLAAARGPALAHLERPGAGEFDTAPLLGIEAALRETTLFAMAALAGEIRAAASGSGPGAGPETAIGDAESGDGEAEGIGAAPPTARAAGGSESVRDTAARAFDLLDAGLDRILAGEGEGVAAAVFLLDDLRTVRGMAPFSSSLDFDPDLAAATEAGSSGGAVLRSDAARVLPSFRKGLAEWTAGEGSTDSAAKLMRGSVSVLARSSEEGMSPARGFWSAAAAFCAALCEHAIPDGPTVRRIMGEVAGEFGEAAEREEAPTPPERLLRELLVYVALAESDHEELQGVRTAFGLERHPLAVPEHVGEPEAEDDDGADGDPPEEVSEEILQQLEGIKAALDRADDPPEPPPGKPPAR